LTANALCKQLYLEQGGSEVPSSAVLKKAKLWNDSIVRNCWKNAGETPEMILA